MVRLAGTQPQHVMGALYEDVETFFGDIFAWYGRIIARFPWLFVVVPVLVCGLLGLGILTMAHESRVDVLYTPIDSMVLKDQAHIENYFTDNTANTYPWQQLSLATYGEVIVTRTGANDRGTDCSGDILAADVMGDIRRLHNTILNITVTTDTNQTYSFQDLCAMRDNHCVVDGTDLLQSPETVARKYHDFRKHDNSNALLEPMVLAGSRHATNVSCYDVIRIRYNLRHNSSYERIQSVAWERLFLSAMASFRSSLVTVYYSVSESLDIALKDHVDQDTRFFGFSIIGMLIFATLIGSGINCVTNHVTLAYAGVFSSLMAITAALGVLSLIGVSYVNLCGVMPFLVLGIGADDVFQLLTEWRQSHIRDTIEERMASTLRSTAVSITITSLTDMIAFCIGATSPYVSIRNFCAYSGVAIFLCYMSQLTFYSGCIVLHARRVQASRHWVTCCTTRSREELEDEGANRLHVLLCAGSPPRRVGEEGGICRKISRILYTYYPKFLLHWMTKCGVFFVFIVYISVSLVGVVRIRKGLNLEQVVPGESYLTDFMDKDNQYFHNNGPVITFMIQGPNRFNNRLTLYHEQVTWDDIDNLLRAAAQVPKAVNGSTVSWLSKYRHYRQVRNMSAARSERQFIVGLESFFEEYPSYRDDVKLSEDKTIITASRFYIRCEKMYDSTAEGELMLQVRRLANSSPLSVVAYSPEFVYFEHYVSVVKNTFLPVGVTMIGLLFVALVFIPHPIAVTCVTIAMISIVLGMVGFLHFWGESLGVITVIQIIMSLGICVSFTVHMSHSFMTATGKNRNERVTVAIEKVGIPILNGAFSSLFSAIMLSFGASFIFTSFFKTMFLVFILGILHSLVFLPVMLSFIGPRRTSKPRVFIPVSPSSRSLQDTFRANSLIPHSPSDIRLDRSSPRPPDPPPPVSSREMGAISEGDEPTEIKINIEDTDDGECLGAMARKVSFAVGESTPTRSDLCFNRPAAGIQTNFNQPESNLGLKLSSYNRSGSDPGPKQITGLKRPIMETGFKIPEDLGLMGLVASESDKLNEPFLTKPAEEVTTASIIHDMNLMGARDLDNLSEHGEDRDSDC